MRYSVSQELIFFFSRYAYCSVKKSLLVIITSLLHIYFAAVKCGKFECIRLLVEAGAHLDSQLYCGTTALHQAASEGMIQVINQYFILGPWNHQKNL